MYWTPPTETVCSRGLGKAHLKKQHPYLPLRANRGGGGSAKVPTSLTDFVCVRNELFELQNKVSIQNLLCYLY